MCWEERSCPLLGAAIGMVVGSRALLTGGFHAKGLTQCNDVWELDLKRREDGWTLR
jgi:hypothetical protein